MPRRTVPCQASPNRAELRLTEPRLATPCLTSPSHASPRHTAPCPAELVFEDMVHGLPEIEPFFDIRFEFFSL